MERIENVKYEVRWAKTSNKFITTFKFEYDAYAIIAHCLKFPTNKLLIVHVRAYLVYSIYCLKETERDS